MPAGRRQRELCPRPRRCFAHGLVRAQPRRQRAPGARRARRAAPLPGREELLRRVGEGRKRCAPRGHHPPAPHARLGLGGLALGMDRGSFSVGKSCGLAWVPRRSKGKPHGLGTPEIQGSLGTLVGRGRFTEEEKSVAPQAL